MLVENENEITYVWRQLFSNPFYCTKCSQFFSNGLHRVPFFVRRQNWLTLLICLPPLLWRQQTIWLQQTVDALVNLITSALFLAEYIIKISAFNMLVLSVRSWTMRLRTILMTSLSQTFILQSFKSINQSLSLFLPPFLT